MFDLLTTIEYGGCSAKLPAKELSEALSDLPRSQHPDLLVDIDTHDDAGVFRISDDVALIQTTDFFPPVCSDPFEFGQIAAANALSDVYAMGGTALTALNIAMFPATRISLEVLKEILRGGIQKVHEAGAVIVGGHTIDDYPPKYGLAVTGTVHPDRIVINSSAQPGDLLVLTKPLGTGIIIAGRRIGEVDETSYQNALDSMKLLNMRGAQVMQEFGVRCATDVTGFGLLGHALKMAQGSGVSIHLEATCLPILSGAYELAELGCLPGACFRNQEFVQPNTQFGSKLDYSLRMLALDAQTSGGLLMCVPKGKEVSLLKRLREYYPDSMIIGEVFRRKETDLVVN